MMDLISTSQSMALQNDTTVFSTMLSTMNETYDNITNLSITNITDINNRQDDGPPPFRVQRFIDFPLFAAAQIMNSNYLIILLAIGAPGNIAAFITVCKMRPFMSSYLYMAVLTIIDTISLSLQLIYLSIALKEYIFIPTFACKILTFFTPFSFYFSNWLLVCMTVDRLVAIWYPLKVAKLNTKKRAIISMSVIAFFLAGLCFDSVIVYEAVLDPLYKKASSKCVIKAHLTNYKYYNKQIKPYIDAIVYAILPVAILLVCNILILKSLRQARKARSVMTNITNKKHQEDQMKQQNQISIMLVTVTTVSIITTFPYVTFFIATKDWVWNTTVEDIGLYYFLESFSTILAHSNHAVNFFLYFFSGRKFRQHFFKLFCTHLYIKSQQSSKHSTRLHSKEMTKNTDVTTITTSNSQYMSSNDDGLHGGNFRGYENKGFSQSKQSLNELPQSINEIS